MEKFVNADCRRLHTDSRRLRVSAKICVRSAIIRVNTKFGFTLIELLVTVSILAIIAAAIVSTFASGFNVYRHIEKYSGTRQDVLLAFEKMERDIRNSFGYSGIPIEGEDDEVHLPNLVTVKEKRTKDRVSVGRVLYYLKGPKGELVREKQPYHRAIKDAPKGRGDIETLAKIKMLKFRYYYYNPGTQSYDWKSSWEAEKEDTKDEEEETKDEEEQEEEVLLGIESEVTFREAQEDVKIKRTVFLPEAASEHMLYLAERKRESEEVSE